MKLNTKTAIPLQRMALTINNRSVVTITSVVLLLIFVINGSDGWAETNVEFYPYALGSPIGRGFAGYFSFFPIAVAKLYSLLFPTKGPSWFVFCAVFSFILSGSTLYYIIRCIWDSIPKWVTILVLCSVFSVLAHPSGNSLTNISHIGYLPIVLYILVTILKGEFANGIGSIPRGALILLVISSLSKPSFFFVLFLFVLIFTNTNKDRLTVLTVSLASFLNIYQIILFNQGVSRTFITKSADIINLSVTSLSAMGGAMLFPFTYYNEFKVSPLYLVIALLIACFVVGYVIIVLLKKRDKEYALWAVGIGISILACIVPYVINAFSPASSIFDNMFNAVYMSTYKYKLQYQLISSPILLLILFLLIDRMAVSFHINKIQYKAVIAFFSLLTINGFLSGIYSAQWQNVKQIKDSPGVYEDTTKSYIFAPLPDWDREWRDSFGIAWYRGAMYVKYLKHPAMIAGSGFTEINPAPLPQSIMSGKLYVVVKEPEITHIRETNYFNAIFHPNKPKTYSVVGRDVQFSEYTSIGYRYAALDVTPELFQILKSDSLKVIEQSSGVIDPKYVNYILAYR